MRRYYNLLISSKIEPTPPMANLRIWTTSEQADDPTNNADVTSLTNLGSDGGSFDQAMATNKPKYKTGGLNGYPYIQPDGINDNMVIALPGNIDLRMLFIVCNYSEGATFNTYEGIFGSSASTGGGYYFTGNPGVTILDYNAASTIAPFVDTTLTNDFAPLNTVKVFGWRNPSSIFGGIKDSYRLFQDRDLAGRFWGCNFYEILVYDVDDTTTFNEALAYLKTKYGI